MTGVNVLANLELLQGEGSAGVDLAAKAQAAMVAANNAKRRHEEGAESDGESAHSNFSHNNKNRKLTSGYGIRSGQKVRYEIEWAHHWLGKEFEANPVAFNQMKMGQYLMGESDIILNCAKPEEIRARLKLMCRMGYWQIKHNWVSARNIYAAIMRGLETGREDWNFDMPEYEDMLMTTSVKQQSSVKEEKTVRKGRDTYFCRPYQWRECDLDSLHMASLGPEGVERMVHHVCSSCLMKDGKKYTHPNGAQGCPRSKH